jgi:hypothetical protein
MDFLKDIAISVDFWRIVAPALLAILAWYLNERGKRIEKRWTMKRDACIQALDIANAVLSSYTYPNVREEDIKREDVSTEEARKCFNTLACTCQNANVLDAFKQILFGNVGPDSIVDLRTAVRKELGIGNKPIDSDRDRAFIGKLGADRG